MGLKLWEVTNGYTGNSYVRCLVIAESEPEAIEAARSRYKAEVEETLSGGRPLYDQRYYDNLQAEVLCNDVTQPWAGTVDD